VGKVNNTTGYVSPVSGFVQLVCAVTANVGESSHYSLAPALSSLGDLLAVPRADLHWHRVLGSHANLANE